MNHTATYTRGVRRARKRLENAPNDDRIVPTNHVTKTRNEELDEHGRRELVNHTNYTQTKKGGTGGNDYPVDPPNNTEATLWNRQLEPSPGRDP